MFCLSTIAIQVACNNLWYLTIKSLALQRSSQVLFHTIEAFKVFLKLARLKHKYRISSEKEIKVRFSCTNYFYFSPVILLKYDFDVSGFRGINLILYKSYFMNIPKQLFVNPISLNTQQQRHKNSWRHYAHFEQCIESFGKNRKPFIKLSALKTLTTIENCWKSRSNPSQTRFSSFTFTKKELLSRYKTFKASLNCWFWNR